MKVAELLESRRENWRELDRYCMLVESKRARSTSSCCRGSREKSNIRPSFSVAIQPVIVEEPLVSQDTLKVTAMVTSSAWAARRATHGSPSSPVFTGATQRGAS